MITLPTFTVLGAPRTKKNSPTIVHNLGRAVLVPSDAYKAWFKIAMLQVPEILRELRRVPGLPAMPFPSPYPCSVRAIFYRAQRSGDTLGFEDGLADWLQAPKMHKKNPAKMARNGAGIILDDSQIEHWDGSRRAHDPKRPRIEVTITLYPEGTQEALPLAEAW